MKQTLRILLTILLFSLCFGRAFSESCDHKWVYKSNGDANHTLHCSKCSETRTEPHSLVSSKTPPSCVIPSVTTYACTKCAYSVSHQDGEPSANHSWGSYVITRKPTCSREGAETRTCTVCGATEKAAIEKTEHNYGDWQKLDNQWHVKYCKACNWAYKGSHRLDSGTIVKAPSETALGEIAYTCRVCEDVFRRSINADGTVYAAETEDVLGNGVKYLLAENTEADTGAAREIRLSGGAIDIEAGKNSEVNVYANGSSLAYAGISVNGSASLELLPEVSGANMVLEFLKLSSSASVSLRIFNSDGSFCVANAGAKQLFISQKKEAGGRIVTLVLQIKSTSDALEGSARIYSADSGEILITNTKGVYSAQPAKDHKLIGQATFKYNKKNAKITASALNESEKADGIAYAVYEGGTLLLSAKNMKKAQGTVPVASENGTWRLRVTFPGGYAFETPDYYKNGAFSALPARALMDQSDIIAMDARPAETAAPEATPAPLASALPEPAPESNAYFEPTPTPSPTPRPLRNLSTENATELLYGADFSYEVNGIRLTVSGGALYVDAPDLKNGTLIQVTVTRRSLETASSYKLQNFYAFPVQYTLPGENSLINIKATIQTTKDKTTDIQLGEYLWKVH